MTSHPTADNHHHWWLVTSHWTELHAIPADAITPQQMRDTIDQATPLTRTAACLTTTSWRMPGIGSRLTLTRCPDCCTTLGIPHGDGTPANQTYWQEHQQ